MRLIYNGANERGFQCPVNSGLCAFQRKTAQCCIKVHEMHKSLIPGIDDASDSAEDEQVLRMMERTTLLSLETNSVVPAVAALTQDYLLVLPPGHALMSLRRARGYRQFLTGSSAASCARFPRGKSVAKRLSCGIARADAGWIPWPGAFDLIG